MAKVLNTYRAYTASDINTRCSDTCDHSVVSSTVECTNVMASKVKTLLSAADYALSTICTHANVNHDSCFGPTVQSYSNSGTLTASINLDDPTDNYSLGSFAGYNHSASAPGWSSYKTAAENDIWIVSGDTPQFDATVNIGEINYASALGCAVSLWDGASFFCAGTTALSGVKDVVAMTATGSAVSSQTTYTGKIYITDNDSTFQSNGSNCLCKVPNVDDYTVTVKIMSATDLIVQPDTFTVSGATFNLTTGECSFTDAVDDSNSYTDLTVTAKLFNWLGNQVGTTQTMYTGAYTLGDHLGALSAKPNGDPIAAYGYSFRIYFTVSA